MAKRTVAVIGASSNRSKFGNKSLRAHQMQGWEVYPVNPNESEVEGVTAYKSVADVPVERLDRVSIYVPPAVGLKVLEEVAAKGADEVWLNPGADAPEVVKRAEELGLNVVRGCSIIDVGMSPRDLSE